MALQHGIGATIWLLLDMQTHRPGVSANMRTDITLHRRAASTHKLLRAKEINNSHSTRHPSTQFLHIVTANISTLLAASIIIQ